MEKQRLNPSHRRARRYPYPRVHTSTVPMGSELPRHKAMGGGVDAPKDFRGVGFMVVWYMTARFFGARVSSYITLHINPIVPWEH